jgi:ketosteroid isomerase-like protein
MAMSMGKATDEQENEQENKQQIRAVLAARAAALRAKDASQFVAAFDPSVVKFDLAPPLQEAGPAVCDPAGLQWWLDTWDGEVQTELADLEIAVDGTVAFCHYLERILGTRTDGQLQDMWIRSTLGLRKRGGAWTITHEHNSAPFYMDGSPRPALDLQP